ncbi:MAG: MoxR family ATPase [Spirochaetes bacterium]|nr:MoxR family ATPase [Spirochaetota bacterium]
MVERVEKRIFELIEKILKETEKFIIGQKDIVKKILISILADGHVLIEGLPGLAKTYIIKNFAKLLNCEFKRIQFTPDLLPADIIGTMIFDPREMKFEPFFGPIFNNIILADEINRAPGKVQSALLQAMAEYEVNLGGKNFKLEKPFYVLATQNPIEHEGTYNLPEAQLDRFMFKLIINYPSFEEELKIIELNEKPDFTENIKPILDKNEIISLIRAKDNVYIDDRLKHYITEIVFSSRYPKDYKISHISNFIEYGASPRASIYLVKCAKTTALINGRDYVLPEDIKYIAYDILRHRIILSYEALSQNITTDYIITEILENRIIP